jgi:hypothetical protein
VGRRRQDGLKLVHRQQRANLVKGRLAGLALLRLR